MIARAAVRLQVIAALTAAAIPGVTLIDSPDDWPNDLTAGPAVRVTAPSDTKVADDGNSGPPHFRTTVSVKVEVRLRALTDTAAQNAIEAINELCENAIFTWQPLLALGSRFANVHSQTDYSAQGEQHLGALVIDLEIETFEADGDWDPPVPGTTIDEIIVSWGIGPATPATQPNGGYSPP